MRDSPRCLFFLAGYAAHQPGCLRSRRRRRPSVARSTTGPASPPHDPCLSAALVVALLGLVGTPPTAVFIGKLTTMGATWDAGLAWLAVAIALNTVVSLFYYLRWIRAALRPSAQLGKGTCTDERGAPTAALIAAASTIVMGLTAGPLWLILT